MGNALHYCMVQQGPTVRVMKADGDVLEFDEPLTAKQLMKLYPGHLVVHCSQVSRSSGQGPRNKVEVLKPQDPLHQGQTYCLLGVPTQRGKVLRPRPPVGGEFDLAMFEQENQYRLPQLVEQQQFGRPWRPHLDAIIESPVNANVPSRTQSITMSPLALRAGYVPMSPLRPAGTPGSRASSSGQSGNVLA